MKRIKHISVLFLCTLIQGFIKAGNLYDSLQVSVKTLPEKPSKIYTGKDFIYEEPMQEPGIFTRLFTWIYEAIRNFLNRSFNFDLKAKTLSGREVLWISLTIILVSLLVIGIIFFLTKFNNNLGRNDKTQLSAEEAEKNIHEVNFDYLIENALKDANYKLAIRFYYLKILKLLSDRKMIEYEYQKTNYEYFYEIKDEQLKNLFKEISTVFDYSWYGDYSVGEDDFLTAKRKFSEVQEVTSKLQK